MKLLGNGLVFPRKVYDISDITEGIFKLYVNEIKSVFWKQDIILYSILLGHAINEYMREYPEYQKKPDFKSDRLTYISLSDIQKYRSKDNNKWQIDKLTKDTYIKSMTRLKNKNIIARIDKDRIKKHKGLEKDINGAYALVDYTNVNDNNDNLSGFKYRLNELGRFIINRKRYSSSILPIDVQYISFKCIVEFMLYLYIGRSIYILKNKRKSELKLRFITIADNIPYFGKNPGSIMTYKKFFDRELIKNKKVCLQSIRKLNNNLDKVLENLKSSGKIKSYETIKANTKNYNDMGLMIELKI